MSRPHALAVLVVAAAGCLPSLPTYECLRAEDCVASAGQGFTCEEATRRCVRAGEADGPSNVGSGDGAAPAGDAATDGPNLTVPDGALRSDGDGVDVGFDATPLDAGGDASSDALADAARDAAPDAAATGDCRADGHRCAESAPSGWTGPIALYDGDPGVVPACSAPFAPVRLADARAELLPAPPAQCSSCTCQPDCFASVTPVFAGSCSGRKGVALVFQAGGCETLFVNQAASVILNAPMAGTQCTPSQVQTTRPALAFQREAKGCEAARLSLGGCPMAGGASSICAPKSSFPFEPGLCVLRTGDVACPPASSYSARRVFYLGVRDTRDCTACACGALGPAASCSIVYSVNTDTEKCTDPGGPPKSPGECADLGGFYDVLPVITTYTTSGTCPASGGAATGDATLEVPVTVCCEP